MAQIIHLPPEMPLRSFHLTQMAVGDMLEIKTPSVAYHAQAVVYHTAKTKGMKFITKRTASDGRTIWRIA